MIEKRVLERAAGRCELCGAQDELSLFEVSGAPEDEADKHIAVCEVCLEQLAVNSEMDANHWRCLNDAIWSGLAAIQVAAWRQLQRLSSEMWARDLLDMVYLDDAVRTWAEAGETAEREVTLDSNGDILQAGDTVHLIKDLNVKGANFTAKRGTPVRNISLSNNPAHIECKINGQKIVIIAAYTKKS